MRPKILVVEPLAATQELLSKLLNEEGFEAFFFGTGAEALRRVQVLAPDLILLEIKLEKENGLEVCREFRKRQPHTPLIVLTEIIDSQTRLEAISCGAVDYLTKPYSRNYLVAKIKSLLAVLQAGRKKVPANPLSALFKQGSILQPEPNSASPYGYAYPKLAEILGLDDPEEQRQFLEEQVARGTLNHVIFDVVKRCPKCHSINVNFRQVCPHCLSPAIKARPLNGTSVREPYPKKEWVCLQCNHVFSEPRFYGRCLDCGSHFEESQAETVVVFSYVENLGEQSPTVTKKAPPSELELALRDSELAFERQEALRPLIRYEIRRSAAANSSFSVLALQFDNLKTLVGLDGSTSAKRRLRNALLVVGKIISPSDQVILGGENRLWILMPETPRATALMVQGQLESYLQRLNLGLSTSLALVGFPEGFQSLEELLEKVETALQAVSRTGRNTVKTVSQD